MSNKVSQKEYNLLCTAILLAEEVLKDLRLEPGGDAYTYIGTTSAVDLAKETIIEYFFVRDARLCQPR